MNHKSDMAVPSILKPSRKINLVNNRHQ